MFSLYVLPPNGVLRIYATGNRVTEESAMHGDYAERGWVSAIGDKHIYQSRDDVRPIYEINVSEFHGDIEKHKEVIAEIDAIIESLGAYYSDSGSTLYMEDAVTDYQSADWYSYAIHAHVKHYSTVSGIGWVEDDIDIVHRN